MESSVSSGTGRVLRFGMARVMGVDSLIYAAGDGLGGLWRGFWDESALGIPAASGSTLSRASHTAVDPIP